VLDISAEKQKFALDYGLRNPNAQKSMNMLRQKPLCPAPISIWILIAPQFLTSINPSKGNYETF
jgi:hypothetical protein